jgi:hypothetical protein
MSQLQNIDWSGITFPDWSNLNFPTIDWQNFDFGFPTFNFDHMNTIDWSHFSTIDWSSFTLPPPLNN